MTNALTTTRASPRQTNKRGLITRLLLFRNSETSWDAESIEGDIEPQWALRRGGIFIAKLMPPRRNRGKPGITESGKLCLKRDGAWGSARFLGHRSRPHSQG